MAYFCFVYVNSMSLVLALALCDSVFQILGLVLGLLSLVLGLGLVSQVLVNITAQWWF